MTALRSITIPYGDARTWASPLDTAELAMRIRECRKASSTTSEKGQSLEQLMVWLLPHLPGFRVRAKDVFSSDHSQEIDILVWNEKIQDGGLPSFGEKLIVECKNWNRRVDSSDVAWFYWKMRVGGVREGILVAAKGVTGVRERRTSAQAILTAANGENPSVRILVITLAEIEKFTSSVDLRDLLIDKILLLTAQHALPR